MRQRTRMPLRNTGERIKNEPNTHPPTPAPTSLKVISSPSPILLYGYHTCLAALQAKRRSLLRIFVTESVARKLERELAQTTTPVQIVSPEKLNARLPKDACHQGILLEALPLPASSLEDLPTQGYILALDQITDPHNVGAIVRTAAAFGVHTILSTRHHMPPLTGTVTKSASGGTEYVPFCYVPNLVRALSHLKEQGYTCVGLDSEGSVSLRTQSFTPPLLLVLGAENQGLRRLTRDTCDVLARIDLPGPIKSLNVSNACAVALALISLSPL